MNCIIQSLLSLFSNEDLQEQLRRRESLGGEKKKK